MSDSVSGHTIKQFDEELAALRDRVLHMGGMVEDQLRRAVAALQICDAEAARAVVRRDREVDRLELQADEEIARLIARRTPLGIDLRTVLTFSKTVTDLERIGDEAKKVARTCAKAGDGCSRLPGLPFMPAVIGMAELAIEQLHGALDTLVRLDLEHAAAVKRGDKRLDKAFKAVMDDITRHLMAEPESAALAINLLFAAKALERVGDHSKNITQYVFYLVEGRDVRHPKSNPAMQT